MITEIKISGFKSIKSQTISLSNINILIGGNGVGKSNFISVFSLSKNLYLGNLQEYVIKKGGAQRLLHFGSKTTKNILVDFTFEESRDRNRFYYELTETHDTLFIASLGTSYFSGIWHDKIYEENVKESSFRGVNTGQAYWVNSLLKGFEVYHFHDTGDESPMKRSSNINDNIYLKSDGSNIASFLYYLKLKHEQHFKRIEQTVKMVAPFFDEFVLIPNRLNEELIQLEWKAIGAPSEYFNSYQLSDGTLRFICLSALLLQPRPPKTIIVDEPELGLHPTAINILANLFIKASKTVQIIVATQSVNFIENFQPENIIVANSHADSTQFNTLKSEELKDWLNQYSIGEIWEKNIFGGLPINTKR